MIATCPRGHDLSTVGETASGECAECNREASRRRYDRRAKYKASLPTLADPGATVDVVGERLHRARAVACYSLEELADLIGISHSALSDAEIKGRVGENTLARLADITGRPLDYFQRAWPEGLIPELQDVAEWLSAAREGAGLTFRELAKDSGTHLSNLNGWINGGVPPTPSTLRRLRNALPGAPWPPDAHRHR